MVAVIWSAYCLAQPGEPAISNPVIDQIRASNSCVDLQLSFDAGYATTQQSEPWTRMHDLGLARMEAADDRMQALGCR